MILRTPPRSRTCPQSPPSASRPAVLSALRGGIFRFADAIAGSYVRSWSIGAWFVASFAAVGDVAQVAWGLSFEPAVLIAVLAAVSVDRKSVV